MKSLRGKYRLIIFEVFFQGIRVGSHSFYHVRDRFNDTIYFRAVNDAYNNYPVIQDDVMYQLIAKKKKSGGYKYIGFKTAKLKFEIGEN